MSVRLPCGRLFGARPSGAGSVCRLLAASIALVIASLPALAAPPDGNRAALAMGRLFVESCLRHAGNEAGLRAVLVPPRFRLIPPGVARVLLPRPGRAFELRGSPGHLMVLSFDDGWCGNGGTGIDPGALTNALSTFVGAAGDGTMKLMGADPDGREQRYMVERPQAAPVVVLVLMTPADAASGGPALVQASLFASEMRAGAGGEP